MNRFKKISLVITALAVSFGVSAQKELIISGGSSVSSMVCSNNYVFVTGSNKVQAGTGTLGVGSSDPYVSTWTKVNFPNSETIQQVNSGSGQSFIALDCDNKVWCWGDNQYGQCGTGSRGGIVTSPQQVKAGCMAGTAYDCGGYLCNVDVVYAGNANSFAILGDGPNKGCVVAWGGNIGDNNYTSCLGTGKTAGNSAPEWCVDLSGNKVKNIIRVFSGDDATLILDSDGHVWSCGSVQKDSGLGRLLNGGYAGETGASKSPSFGMVYVAAGEPLSNIVEIAAGDVAYFALDADGYIWSWGDTWNHACGQGANVGSKSPKRVVKGNTLDVDNDGTYLLAKSVGAGQSSGMAVSISGRPVTWGANSGQGSTSTAEVPGYVQTSGGTIHTDVILINKGDNWGFYGRSDGSMYAWGQNDNGQLGVGSTSAKSTAEKINPPKLCDAFKDPKPDATITPKSMKVCASDFAGVDLDCGFVVSTAMQPNYKITWYKDGTQVSTGDGKNAIYKTQNGTNGIGTYKVKIEYVGDNAGCEKYQPSEDEIEISAYTKTFEPEGFYCGDAGMVKVSTTNPTAVYTWWETSAARTAYGQSLGTEEISIDVSSITANADGTKTVYVSETSMGSGYLLPGTQASRTSASNSIQQSSNGAKLGVEFGGKTTVSDVSLYLLPALTRSNSQGSKYDTQEEAESQYKALTASVTITLKIYGTKMNNGKHIANTSDVKKTITKTISYDYDYYPDKIQTQSEWNSSLGTNVTKYQPIWQGGDLNLPLDLITIPVDATMESGIYYFGVAVSGSGAINTNNTKLYELNSGTVGQADNMSGTVVVYGADNYNNYATDKSGPLFNFHVLSGQGYCDVIEVKLAQDCPCEEPADFAITCTDASLYNKETGEITICENAATCTLGTEAWATSGSKFEYLWYKDGTLSKAATVGNTSASYSVTDKGVYKILVRDKGMPDAEGCQKSAEVEVKLNPVPTVVVSGGGSICEGETLTTPVTFTMTGEPKFTVYWDQSDKTKQQKKKSEAYTVVVDQPTAVGEYTYTVASVNDDGECKNESVTGTATVIVKPIPSATITANKEEMCEGDEAITLTAESDQTGAEFTWGGKGSGTTNPLTLTLPAQSGEYIVTASLNGCDSVSNPIEVTINPKPVIKTLTSDVPAVCSGETITLSATTSDSEAGTFTWSGDDGISGTGKQVTISKTVTEDTEVTITLNYESVNGCEAEPKDIKVTFYAMPEAPKPADVSYCEKATAVALTATASAGGTLYWYGTNATGGTGSTTAPTPSTAVGTAEKTYYYVSQKVNGCESERAMLTVTVNSSLEPTISIDDDELCDKEIANVTLTQSYDKVTWSGTATTNFDATDVATPKFTAGAVGSQTEYTIIVDVVDGNGCKGTGETKLTVYPTPTVILSDPAAVCSGESTTITATVTATPATGGTYTWSTNVGSTSETSATYSETTSGTVTYDYTSAKGCKAAQVSKDVTIYDIPEAPTPKPVSYCVDATAVALTATAATDGTLYWYGTNATGGTGNTTAPTPSTAESAAGETTYYVSQKVNGCESERASLVVTVNTNLSPEITLSDNGEVCEGNAVTVGLTQTFKTVEWSGAATAEFNSTSTATPVFKNTAAAGTYALSVKVTDVNGCEGTGTGTIIINPKPVAEFKAELVDKCISETTAQTLEVTITPTGTLGEGTFAGEKSGVITKSTETTASYNPSVAGEGTHTITYDFVSAKGCIADQIQTDVEVFALPTPTITVSNDNVCVSGNNSAKVTMSTTGTSADGTFAYSVDNGVIDATTGDFDPTANVKGTYTVTLTYIDKNGCQQTATDQIVVNALPTVSIVPPTQVCYNAAEITINPVVSPDGGTGVWTGTKASEEGSFDPKTNAVGNNEITYTYTDPNKCQDVATATIEVVKVEKPTVGPTQTVLINSGSVTGSSELTATATTAGDNLSWMEETGGTELKSGTSYDMGVTAATAVGSYKFAVKEYRTVNGAACYSDSTIATLVVSACEALAPEASDIYVCLGDDERDQTLTAARNASSTIAASHISWLSIDPVGTSGTSSDDKVLSTLGSDAKTYAPGVSVATIQDFVYYAAEYDETNNCWSAGTKVTLHVVDTPSVTISSPLDICAIGSEAVPVTVSPQTGTLTADKGTISGFNWLPGDYTDASEKAVFTYVVKSDKYADNTECTTTVKSETTAHFMEKPGNEMYNWLIGDIAGIPEGFLKGSNTSTGEKMTWYENMTTETSLGTGTEYTPDRSGLQAAVGSAKTYSKTYYISQTDANGCESERAEVVLNLVDCPWEAPIVTGDEQCQNKTLANLEGTAGASVASMSTTGSAEKWNWYKEDNTLIETTTSSSYAHGVSSATDGVTKFYVSYVATEKNSGQACESPKTSVTVTVNKLPDVTVEDVHMCYAQGKTIVKATANGVSSDAITSGGEWTIDGATTNINASTGEVDPSFGGKVDGTYTMKYTYTDAKGCVNSDEAELAIEYPEIPTTVDFIGLITDESWSNVVLTAGNIETGKTAVAVNWYAEDKMTKKSSDNPWTTADTKTAVEKSYWVTQTVDGCESEQAEQKVQIVDCPWKAPTVVEATVCQDVATIPSMTAEAQSGVTVDKWVWKKAGSDLNNNDASYTQVSNSTKGITEYQVSYWATEPISGVTCESPSTKVTTTVYGLPEITFAKATEDVCYTDGSVQINVTATAGDDGNGNSNGVGSGVWTSDNNAVSSSNIFNTKVNGETTGTYDLTYTYTDGKGCVNEATRKITVTYLPKPETEGFYAMTTQKNPIEVKVTSSVESGAVVKWFTNETSVATSVGEGKTWQTGDAVDMTWNKNYYARQYSAAGGCYSEPTEALVKVVPCPIPAVTISNEKACNYEEIPTLTAVTNDWSERDGSKSEFYFYASGKTTVESKSADGTYQPSGLTAGEYTYNVSEYNAVPLIGLTHEEGCEGPKTPVKITIIGTGVPSVMPMTGEVCEGEKNPTFTSSNVVGTIGWYEEDPGVLGVPETPERGNKETFVPTGSTADTYSVWAVMYNDGCYGPKVEVTYTIKEIPAEPTVENAEICYGEANKNVTATGVGTVNWYSDASKMVSIQKGSKEYLSKETMPGEYKYYAAQTVKGCEGKTSMAIFKIKPLPSVPVVMPQSNICDYDEAPMVHASGENITWYASDKATVLGDGESYQTTDMSAGTKRYYASQTVDGCEGEKSVVSFTIFEKPANPTVTGANVCEGNDQIPSLSTNMSMDKWYADETANTYLAMGYNYTPVAAEVGNTDKTYYVQRDLNNCVSDVVPVTLHVIPKPEFTISNDTTLCIYDAVIPIYAKDFSPAMNEASTVQWQVKRGNVVKHFDGELDAEGNNIVTPTSVITAEDDYTVSGCYKYVYENVYCTSDTLSMVYSVKGRARTPIVFSSVICQGEEIKDLRALGSPNVTWGSLGNENGFIPKPIVCQGTRYKFDAGQVLDTGTYRFVIYDMNIYDEANNLGCKSEVDTVTMTVAPAAQTKLFGPDSVCVETVGEQYYTQYTKESTYFWNVTGDNLNYSKDMSSTSVRYVDWMHAGVDTISVYEQTWAGCEGFDTLVVRIAPIPEPHISWSMPGASNIIEMADSTIQDSLWIPNEEGVLVAEEIPYTMMWNFGHQGQDNTVIDTVVEYDQRRFAIREGDYIYGYNCPILTVKNSFGCKATTTECIFVNITSSLYVPTAFSPTNPAHSVRKFGPKGYNLKTCEISVYDKWGNLLWYSDEVRDGMFVGTWDGTYEGKMMKSDVYIWKMEASFLDGQTWEGFDSGNGKKTKFGSVTLVR